MLRWSLEADDDGYAAYNRSSDTASTCRACAYLALPRSFTVPEDRIQCATEASGSPCYLSIANCAAHWEVGVEIARLSLAESVVKAGLGFDFLLGFGPDNI